LKRSWATFNRTRGTEERKEKKGIRELTHEVKNRSDPLGILYLR